ncbi:MAG: hypothetical protein JSS51_06830 [Planctomycetes bacterium]|nr:hypothetical protein [Planctomycetota bacterium]
MRSNRVWVGVAAAASLASSVLGSHHIMQIQKVIGGVGGDTTAQAIQLRQRFAGQNLVSFGRIRAWDANGANPVLIIDFTANVPNSASGDTVLVCTNSFKSKTSPTTTPDFTMTNPIPPSYLAAGRLTFEFDGGTIWWSLAWGGASYTGSNAVDLTNDSDGNAGPAFGQSLPTASTTALQYTGGVSGASTTNAANYAISAPGAIVTNNARVSFTVKAPCPGDFNGDAFVDDADFVVFAAAYDQLICGNPCPADLNADTFVDDADFVLFAAAYNDLICP